MNDPSVSVIIPTHNRVGWLRQCLGSVLNQAGVDLEVIVVNDGSSDTTMPMLARVGDDRVRVVEHETALGVSAARNDGIDAASGTWVSFVDDDDLLAPQKLQTQLAALEASGATWSCTAAMLVTSDLVVVGCARPPHTDAVAGDLLLRNAIPGGGSGVVVARQALERTGGFDPSFSSIEDWDLWLRLAGDGRLAAVDQPLLAYRSHYGSSSTNVSRFYDEAQALARKHDGVRPQAAGGVNFHQARAVAAWLSGRRMDSVSSFVAGARAHRNWRDIGHAVAVGVSPDLRRTSAWYFGRHIPPGWRAQTEAWLSAYASL